MMFKSKLYKQLDYFLKSEPRLGNTAMFSNRMFASLYLRNTFLYLPEFSTDKVSALVIARIELRKKFIGQGHASRILDYIHKNNKNQVTKLELVYEDKLANWAIKRDFLAYRGVGNYDLVYSYVKFNDLKESPIRFVVRQFYAIYDKAQNLEFGLAKANCGYGYKIDEVQDFKGDTYYRVYKSNGVDILDIISPGIFNKFFYEVSNGTARNKQQSEDFQWL